MNGYGDNERVLGKRESCNNPERPKNNERNNTKRGKVKKLSMPLGLRGMLKE
jgi:hypothetical protein